MGLDRLWDLLTQVWTHLIPIVVIQPYDNAGLIRLGQYKKTLEPGWHWKIPFADEINTQTVSLTTIRLPPQSVTTKDGVGVVVASVVRFFLKDVKPYITEVTDQKDVLIDITMGSIRKQIHELTYKELMDCPPEEKVLKAVRDRVNRYGFKVEEVTFTDLAKVRSFRLIQPHPLNLDN